MPLEWTAGVPALPLPLPTAIVLATGLVALGGGSLVPRRHWWAAVVIAGFAAAGVAKTLAGIPEPDGPVVAFGQVASLFDWLLLSNGLAFAAMLAGLPAQAGDPLSSRREGALAAGLLAITTGGAMLVPAATSTPVLVLGMELTVVPLAVLLSRTASGPASRDAVRRFLATEGLAFATIVAGLALLHEVTGSNDLEAMAVVDAESAGGDSRLATLAVVLLVCGSAIRTRLAPFHEGTEAAHAATSSWTAGVVATLPRIAVAAFLVRLLPVLARVDGETARLLAVLLAMLAMLAGGIGGVFRRNPREVLAAASMGHYGIVLACLAVGIREVDHVGQVLAADTELPGGVQAGLFALVVHVAATTGLYAALVHVTRPERPVDFEDDLTGLFRTEPAAAVSLAALLVVLAGLPPFAGFWSRLLSTGALASVTGEGHRLYLVAAIVVSLGGVLLLAVPARWMVVMLFEPPRTATRPGGGEPALAIAVLAAVLLAGTGLVPAPLLAWIRAAVSGG